MKNKLIILFLILIVFLASFIGSINKITSDKGMDQHIIYKDTNNCNSNDEEFCTHLPLVIIDTGNKDIPGEERDGSTITTNVKIIDNKSGGNHLEDKSKVNTLANIRYRGNSSMYFDKKGYLLKFIHEDGTENKEKVMGMKKHDEWALHGPFLDKTLIRNYLWYHISSKIMDYAPDSRFCELYVDGVYQGVYLMVETPTRADESRMPISKYNDGDDFTSYIVRLDKGSLNPLENVDTFSGDTYNRLMKFDVIYPGKNKLNQELNKFISEDISKFEKALYSYDYDSIRYGYRNYIDVNSFVDYYIINEFTQNYDAGSMSTYIYKDLKGDFGIFVWDFNSANNNYVEQGFKTDILEFQWNTWYYMFMKDEYFTQRIIDRYHYLRKNYLNEEYLLNYIDDIVEYLGPAIDRNFEVWGYTFEQDKGLLQPIDRNVTSYEEAIKQLKEHIINRGRFLDENIDTIKQFSSESKVKKFNH